MQKISFQARHHPRRASCGNASGHAATKGTSALRRVAQHRAAQPWTQQVRRVGSARRERGRATPLALSPSTDVTHRAILTTPANAASPSVWKMCLMGAALVSVACPVVQARYRPGQDGGAVRSRDGTVPVYGESDMSALRARESSRSAVEVTRSVPVSVTLDPRTATSRPSSVVALGFDASTYGNVSGDGYAQNATAVTASANDTLASSPGLNLLREDWLSEGTLTHFLNGPPLFDFLAAYSGVQDHDAIAEMLKTREGTLLGLFRSLKPGAEAGVEMGRSPWDAANFNATAFDALMQREGISLGYGAHTDAQTDPAFRQSMFVRLVSTIIWPERLSNGEDPMTIPSDVRAQWLDWLRPGDRIQKCHAPYDADTSGNTTMTGVPDTNVMRERLSSYVFRGEEDLGDARAWVTGLVGAMIDPTLGLHGSVGAMQVGDLPWALMRIGMTMAGPDAWQMSPPELTALAVTAYQSAIANDAAFEAFFHVHAETLLLYAHAMGLVDLRDENAATLSTVRTAIDAFDARMHQTFNTPGPVAFEALRGELPSRAAILSRELARQLPGDKSLSFKARGLSESTSPYARRIAYGASAIVRHVRGDCVTQDEPYALENLILDGCMDDIHRISPDLGARLHDAGLDTDGLTRRFNDEFTASVAHVRDKILRPSLAGLVRRLAPEDFRHWTCGTWQIRVPSVTLVVPMQNARDRFAEAEATQVVFVAATIGGTTRHFALTLSPLTLVPFDGDVEAWLRAKPNTLFGGDGELLKRVDGDVARFRTIEPSQAGPNVSTTEAVAAEFADRLEAFREAAYAKTPTQAHREAVRRALLSLIPFYNCVDDVHSGTYAWATIDCGVDIVSAIPLTYSALMAERAALQVSRTLVGAVLDDVSQNVVRRAGIAGGLSRVLSDPALASAVDVANSRFKDTGIALMRFVDPGVELGARGLLRLPEFGWRFLARVRDLPLLSREAGRWAREAHEGVIAIHEDGVWHVPASQKAALQTPGAWLGTSREPLMLARLGDKENVVVRHEGRWMRLANPYSGQSYGPLLGVDAQGRLAHIPSETVAVPFADEDGALTARGYVKPETTAPALDGPLCPEAGVGLRQRRAPPAVHAACDILTGSAHVRRQTPLFGTPFILKRRTGEPREWVPVDVNDVAVRVSRLDWPDGYTFDEYWLDGEVVLWRENSVGRAPVTRVLGELSESVAGNGMVLPAKGYVRAEFWVSLGEFKHPAHVARRADLHTEMALHMGERDHKWVPDEALAIQVAWPFAGAVDANGCHFGVVTVRERHYRFAFPEDASSAFRATLYPATPDEVQAFRTTQNAMTGALHAREVDGQTMLRPLRDVATPNLSAQVENVFDRADDLLRSAREALRTPMSPMVETVLDRFAPGAGDQLADALRPALHRMNAGLQAVSRARGEAIGVMESEAGVLAASLGGTLRRPELADHLDHPVIGFDTSSLACLSVEVQAATLLHELSHVSLATTDARGSEATLYGKYLPAPRAAFDMQHVESLREVVEQGAQHRVEMLRDTNTPRYVLLALDRLVGDGLVMDVRDLVGQTGADVVNQLVGHASSMEHLVNILAYAHDPSHHSCIAEFMDGGTSYQRYPTGYTPPSRQLPQQP